MTSKIDIFASAIIYCSHNNHNIVIDHLQDVHDQMKGTFRDYEIIIVNNLGGGLNIEPVKKFSSLTILNLSYVHGREQAMTAGADMAIGDFLYEFDYMPTVLPDGILRDIQKTAFDNNADIVVAKNKKGAKITSRIFYYLLHKLSVTDVTMGTDLIRLISRRALNSVLKDRRSFRFRKLLYMQSGFRSETIYSNELKIFQESEPKARMALAGDVITSLSKLGSSISKLLAFFFLSFTVLIAAYAIGVKLSGLPIAEGWTTMMVFLCMAFSGVFIILSLIARTAEMILLELQNAQPYRVRDITRIES